MFVCFGGGGGGRGGKKKFVAVISEVPLLLEGVGVCTPIEMLRQSPSGFQNSFVLQVGSCFSLAKSSSREHHCTSRLADILM